MDSLALGIFLGYTRSSVTSSLPIWGGILLFHTYRYLYRMCGGSVRHATLFYASAAAVGIMIGHASIGGIGYGIGYALK